MNLANTEHIFLRRTAAEEDGKETIPVGKFGVHPLQKDEALIRTPKLVIAGATLSRLGKGYDFVPIPNHYGLGTSSFIFILFKAYIFDPLANLTSSQASLCLGGKLLLKMKHPGGTSAL